MIVDVVVIGSGPAGLSCAIEAQNAGLTVRVLEKGSLVDAIRRFPTAMVWFSTPELLEIGGVPFVISTVRPTRVDTLNYYQKVARHFSLDVRYHDAVVSLQRRPGGFVVRTAAGEEHEARNVVVATGYFDHPNRLGVPGEDGATILHYYSEPYAFFGREVVVVGGRNSAVEAALDLYRHGVRVTLVHRGESLSAGVKYWILPDIENRIKSGEIRALFRSRITAFAEGEAAIETPAGPALLPMDAAFVLTGFLPDAALLRSFGVRLDAGTLAPVLASDTLETSVPGLYVAGSVVAGRNTNAIFVENGRAHGAKIVQSIRAGSG